MSEESKLALKILGVVLLFTSVLIALSDLLGRLRFFLKVESPWIKEGLMILALAITVALAAIILFKQFRFLEWKIRQRMHVLSRESRCHFNEAERLGKEFAQLNQRIEFYINLTHHLLNRVDELIQENKALRQAEVEATAKQESFQKLADGAA
ncbi:MAG: hypothetical protein AB1540_06020 [Bdellovibrionota bacterium]